MTLRAGKQKTPSDYVLELSEKLTEVEWWIHKPQVVHYLPMDMRKRLLNRIKELRSQVEVFEQELEDSIGSA